MKQQITDYDVITAMERYGGGFACNLAKACMHADSQNLARIKLTFADLWQQYGELAEKIKEKEDEKPTF